MKRSLRRPTLAVTADGTGVAAHAGSRLLADMADAVGLTEALSVAMAPVSKRKRRHDPGRVLLDLSISLADGGRSLSDLRVLRDQPSLFGEVASTPTASRVIDTVTPERLSAIRTARKEARKRAWALGIDPQNERMPLTLDFDATLLDSSSEKEGATPTYQRGFGFHPLACWLDQTHEPLAGILREGRAGANDADDHVKLLDLALAQLPVSPKGVDAENGVAMLVRADSAGATHVFTDALRNKGIEFSISFDVTKDVRLAITRLPNKAWIEAIRQDGDVREGAQVAEITHLLDLKNWPEDTRAIVRREEPHPGAQFTLFEEEGWRHQVFITDSIDEDIAFLEARHRGHARVEDRIRTGKDTGLRNLPFESLDQNACWLELVLLAQDLICYTQGLALDGEMAKAEPRRLRYALLHTAGRLTTSGRRTTLRLQCEWPWAKELARAFERVDQLSLVT